VLDTLGKSSLETHPFPRRTGQLATLIWLGTLLGLGFSGSGCASHRLPQNDRTFRMHIDSMAYANELVWDYQFDLETGQFTHDYREPRPSYTHHCFVMAKAARQFFEHSLFDPTLPAADERTYRKLIRQVTGMDPARLVSGEDKIIIPGYPHLHAFSRDWETLLKEECGGAWRSYTQRGHWRMILPFSRSHQQETATELQDALNRGHPPLIHLVKFPSLTINHAAMLIGFEETNSKILFETYDPNRPDQSTTLTFDKVKRAFSFPRNQYFVGGEVDVYEIYKSWNY
jgi:hypothetical protein